MQNRRTMAIVVCFCSMTLFAFQVNSETAQNAPGSGKQNAVVKKGASAQPVLQGGSTVAPSNGAKNVPPDSVSKPADLLPAQAAAPQCTVRIKCDPAGAAVYFDDSLKGAAPVTITDITPGNHVLTLKKKGYFLKKAEITVDSTTIKELSFVLLQPGYLKVETMPSGADLWIDDKKEGTTPYETDRIKPGDHTVKVELSKYAPQERTITLGNGGRDSLKLALDYTRAYKEEMAAAQATQAREHKERMYLGIVSGLFVLGALVLVIIEAMGQ